MTDRFWGKVQKGQPGGCWLWTAANDNHGYGVIRVNYRLLKAHRYAYERLVGPIPEGYDIDHLCRTRSCVNPAHLEPVTRRENLARGAGNGGDKWNGSHYNTRKTHCLRGHEFTEENTYHKGNQRHCRTCRRERAAAKS